MRYLIKDISTVDQSVNQSALSANKAVQLENTVRKKRGMLTKRRGYSHTSIAEHSGTIRRIFGCVLRSGERLMFVQYSSNLAVYEDITTSLADGDLS